MKTSEEIKKALKICSMMRPCHRLTCKDCPYDEKCRRMCDEADVVPGSILMKDALVYINYLEEHVEAYMRQSERVENLDLVSRSELLKKAGWYNLCGENRSIYAVSVKEIEEMLPAYHMPLPKPPEEMLK